MLSSTQCYQLTTTITDIECVFVCTKLNKLSKIIGAANMPCSKYDKFCDAVIEVTSSNPSISDLILLGDLNHPSKN